MQVLPKPKSAPGMQSKVLQSKFVRAKSDRTKEIEGWARQGRKNVEFVRQSGGLSENITEDLMLHEKLMDLSKSRYKFITSNKFEQKMFLQRQMKKSVALREALKDIDLDKTAPKWASEAPKSRSSSVSEPEPVIQPKRKVTRDKPESAPTRRRPIPTDDTPPRPQTRATYSIESRISSASTEHNFFQTQPKITKRKYNVSETGKSTVTFSEPPKTAPASQMTSKVLGRRSSIRRGSLHKTPIASWAKKNNNKVSGDDRGPMKDCRYTDLADSLSEAYKGKPSVPEVDKIISVIGSLHIATNRPMESRRPKVTNKIKEFLLQSGITMNA